MKKVLKWLLSSNRWLHLVGGFVIGFAAGSPFSACYAGLGIAAALELKDRQHGGKWDWIDFILTCGGTLIGCLIRALL